jgi:chloramphenicol-sensitive protein RarD
MQMTWGVLVGNEPMPPLRWMGFGLIWIALLVFTIDAVRRGRADKRVSAPFGT